MLLVDDRLGMQPAKSCSDNFRKFTVGFARLGVVTWKTGIFCVNKLHRISTYSLKCNPCPCCMSIGVTIIM